MVEVSEAGLGNTQPLEVGEELRLRLPENPTTGFRWHLEQSGDGELELLDDRHEPAEAAVPGAAGHRIFRCVARKAGTVELQLTHKRAWEPKSHPSRPLVIVIR